MKVIVSFFIFFITFFSKAQEIDCQVIVNSSLVDQTNQKIFETLEKSLNEFINNNIWTDNKVLNKEKISCSIIINLTKYESSNFEGTFQIQSSRPIFNSNYNSTIINIIDKDISFNYQEFQPLYYNSSIYSSNLISLISFYTYLIIGLDADSFQLNSGTKYYNEAQKILNLAQQNNSKGWNQVDGSRNRFWIIDSLMSKTYEVFRSIVYDYHRNGLDFMIENPQLAKKNILDALTSFNKIYLNRPNSYLVQTFFDAKSDEIIDILSGGPIIKISKTIKILNKVSPFFGSKWKSIEK